MSSDAANGNIISQSPSDNDYARQGISSRNAGVAFEPALSPPAAPGPTSTNTAVRSATVTLTETAGAEAEAEPEVLELTLRSRPQVRWDESVVDNEGMGRKSSKRCCIFHKQRDFGESSTDSSDYDSDRSDSSAAYGADGDPDSQAKRPPGRKGRIARPKKEKSVPDYQRFHA